MTITQQYANLVRTTYRFTKLDILAALLEKYKIVASANSITFEVNEETNEAVIIIHNETPKETT